MFRPIIACLIFLVGILTLTGLEDPSALESTTLSEAFSSYRVAAAPYLELQSSNGTEAALTKLTHDWEAGAAASRHCHIIMHMIAHESYREYGSLAKALEIENYDCDGGYIHGLVEAAAADNAEDWQNLVSECAALKDETTLKGQCYHGVGHAFMFVNDNDVSRAAEACRNLGSSVYESTCIKGAYMQHFIEEISTDTTAHVALCQTITEETEREHCLYYSRLPHFRTNPDDYQSVILACDTLNNSNKTQCLQGLVAYHTSVNATDLPKVVSFCTEVGLAPSDCNKPMLNQLTKYHTNSAESRTICERLYDDADLIQLCKVDIKPYISPIE